MKCKCRLISSIRPWAKQMCFFVSFFWIKIPHFVREWHQTCMIQRKWENVLVNVLLTLKSAPLTGWFGLKYTVQVADETLRLSADCTLQCTDITLSSFMGFFGHSCSLRAGILSLCAALTQRRARVTTPPGETSVLSELPPFNTPSSAVMERFQWPHQLRPTVCWSTSRATSKELLMNLQGSKGHGGVTVGSRWGLQHSLLALRSVKACRTEIN